jgi:hypothetical protein
MGDCEKTLSTVLTHRALEWIHREEEKCLFDATSSEPKKMYMHVITRAEEKEVSIKQGVAHLNCILSVLLF